MPELPEVETVRRGLAPVMEGAVIARAELRRPDLRFPFPARFAELLCGQKVLSLGRRAKYLLIDLEGGDVVIAHLGMSGSFRVVDGTAAEVPGDFHHPRGKDERHDHVVLHLDTEGGRKRVIYNDPRRFGFMDLARREALADHPYLRDLGEEPTGNALDAAYLAARFRGKSQPLKTALLDQKTIAGLGNIYVCEALWRAHLAPERPAGSLVTAAGKPRKELLALTEAIRAVIAEAIEAGGSTLRDHIRADGSLGYFQHSFSVYDREGEACRTPGCRGTIGRIVQAGRSTFQCTVCQK
ncbi:bifunctional DNA-formamidopyrimidine glycosylase/DNA-(apurinic or apyrimidinic site) lyase [Mycoplana dimorpha]|uniref:Formamidopyrimidine-DNA glycosylase n=1 Tax=Mycoplana dimorpha TaxID=28320 RepID=A0A2T5BET1_MYCDI|nr:bifunctional DNA-formamidopyrimidine glycosylase/DNA-(apurinic or apyrimidinic site) lyase [Mycoplana dimorpha]PTM97502.1 DNA-(apurinic or apyrimidinic site) lyase [Mycoplana dimorpha]